MLVEYGQPSKDLMRTVLNIINEYSDNPLAPDVAAEENQWLDVNEGKFKM